MTIMSNITRAHFHVHTPDDRLAASRMAPKEQRLDMSPVLERVLLKTMTRDNESRRRFLRDRWRVQKIA
jgi:hypothetical protein